MQIINAWDLDRKSGGAQARDPVSFLAGAGLGHGQAYLIDDFQVEAL
jgi:hypothetical protein